MKHHVLPFTITNKILLQVSSISEKIGRFTSINNLNTKPHLRKNNRIRSIHSSLRIEANSLSLGQVRDVINGKTVLGDQEEIQEVKNAFAAYEQLSDIDPYRISDLLKMHGIMTNNLIYESGKFRKGEEGVFSGDTCIFMAPPARMVPSLMDDLFQWMNREKNNIHPLILSCVFHYEFVFIHPFSDGNGRMARLWHTAILSKWNPLFEFIPIESQIEKFQDAYYETISICHKESSSTTFIEFMLAQIDLILDDLSTQVDQYDVIPEQLKKLLNMMEYDVAYRGEELMNLLGLKSLEGFRKHYLRPALDLHLIQMTQAEKPRSKNQKYMKV